MTSSDIAEKPPVTAPPQLSSNDEEKHGSVTELDDLTVLGYKPELQRNRSMFTLLFQSLAIAAVSANVHPASFSSMSCMHRGQCCMHLADNRRNGRYHMVLEDL